MTESFEASNINDLIECMLAYIKTQTENPKFPESGFSIDKIMYLYTYVKLYTCTTFIS